MMPRRKGKKTEVSEYFVKIHNLTHSGKQIIVFQEGEWRHYWLPSKSLKHIKKPFKASSSLLEMVRRSQIEIIE